MGYLIWQIILCLLIAFLFGLLIGCWLRSIACKKKINEMQDKKVVTPASTAKKTNVTDDLKKIKGVGPKLEKMLNKNGIKNFKQVAELTSSEIEDLSTKLGSFKNRIIRDDWVSKARDLHFQKYGEKV